MFDRVGAIAYPSAVASEEAVLEAAIEAGADDVQSSDEMHQIYCALDSLSEVAAALEAKFGEAESAKPDWRPKNTVSIEGESAATLMKMMTALEDCDDVQNVYANFDIASEELERLAG